MPTFGAPLNGISHSDALKQAITHAESSDPILVTLSMYNATFVDGNGNPTWYRRLCAWSAYPFHPQRDGQ